MQIRPQRIEDGLLVLVDKPSDLPKLPIPLTDGLGSAYAEGRAERVVIYFEGLGWNIGAHVESISV